MWPFHTHLYSVLLKHTYSSWFSTRTADMCLRFTSERLLLCGSHLLTTEPLSELSSPVCPSCLAFTFLSFHVDHCFHHTPSLGPNHSRHWNVFEQFEAHVYFRGCMNSRKQHIRPVCCDRVADLLLVRRREAGGVAHWAHHVNSPQNSATSLISLLFPSACPLISRLPTSPLLRSPALEWPCARGCHGESLLSQQRGRTNWAELTHAQSVSFSHTHTHSLLTYTQGHCRLFSHQSLLLQG